MANNSNIETILAVLEGFTLSLENDNDITNDIFKERKIQFSWAMGSNLVLTGVLGLVNIYDALYLENLLEYYNLNESLDNLPIFYYDTITDYLPGLVAFAVLYNAIPLV